MIAERLADDLVFSWKFRKRTEKKKKKKTERDEFASPVRTRKSEAHFEFAPYLLSKPETRGVMTRRSVTRRVVFVFRFRARRQSVFYSCAREGVFAFGRFPGETVGLIARSLVFNRRSERRAGFSTGHAR